MQAVHCTRFLSCIRCDFLYCLVSVFGNNVKENLMKSDSDTIIDVWNLLLKFGQTCKLQSACCTVNTSSHHKICANTSEPSSSYLCFSVQKLSIYNADKIKVLCLSSHCTCCTWFEIIIYIYIHKWYVFETPIWTVWMA